MKCIKSFERDWDSRWIACSRNNTFIAYTRNCDDKVKLINIKTSQQLFFFAKYHVTSIPIFSSNEKYLYATTGNNICKWSIEDNNNNIPQPPIKIYQKNDVYSFDLSEDGTFIVSGGRYMVVSVIDENTNVEIQRFVGHTNIINCVEISPDQQNIISASYDHTVRMWDRKTGKQVLMLQPSGSAVLIAKFSVNGKLIATASSDGIVSLWDIMSHTYVFTVIIKTVSSITELNFPRNNPFDLIVRTHIKDIVLDVITGDQKIQRYFEDYDAPVSTYSWDNRFLITGGDNEKIKIWAHPIFLFNGSNYSKMPVTFRKIARTFLLCCKRLESKKEFPQLPRDMRQIILVFLSYTYCAF